MNRISARTRRIATAAGLIAAGGALALLAPTAALKAAQSPVVASARCRSFISSTRCIGSVGLGSNLASRR